MLIVWAHRLVLHRSMAKIEVVWFSSIDTDFYWHAGGQMQALLSKESLSLGLEIRPT